MIIALIERLEREVFAESDAADAYDLGYRAGWNARSTALIEVVRVELGLAELARAVATGPATDAPFDLSDTVVVDVGGES